jgi:putative PIN family toxin of toxin-antitoxin system
MRRRVVFDVNTLISAFISPAGSPGQAVKVAIAQHWDIGISTHIVGKALEVLSRPKFRRLSSGDDFGEFLVAIQSYANIVVPDLSVRGIAPDEEDDVVLGTAVAARADFLVTGDKGLLAIGEHLSVSIVTAREFLAVMAQLEA